MAHRIPVHAGGATMQEFPGPEAGESRELLRALFKSSTVGVAICNRKLRFCAVNDALACMNGVPAAEHVGKTLHAVLGKAASKVQSAFDHVFTTGQALSNFELTAELPSRIGVGHWKESYFPIRNNEGRVLQVGAIVLEMTKRTELDAALQRLIRNLTRVSGALREGSQAPWSPGGGNPEGVVARSIGQLENCMADVRAISHLLLGAPPLIAVRPKVSLQSKRRRDVSFPAAHSIEQELGYICPLTLREREVTVLLARGKSNKEIAAILTISTRTVEAHRARIMLKLDLHSLSDLVLYAVRSQLIPA